MSLVGWPLRLAAAVTLSLVCGVGLGCQSGEDQRWIQVVDDGGTEVAVVKVTLSPLGGVERRSLPTAGGKFKLESSDEGVLLIEAAMFVPIRISTSYIRTNNRVRVGLRKPGEISGRVVSQSGGGLDGVVSVTSKAEGHIWTRSDRLVAGQFRLAGVPVGPARVSVNVREHLPVTMEVQSPTSALRILMESPAIVAGVLTTAEGGRRLVSQCGSGTTMPER